MNPDNKDESLRRAQRRQMRNMLDFYRKGINGAAPGLKDAIHETLDNELQKIKQAKVALERAKREVPKPHVPKDSRIQVLESPLPRKIDLEDL